jgi:hypothetical protein
MNNVLSHFNPSVIRIRTHLACFDLDHSIFMFDNAHKMSSLFEQWTRNLSSLIWTMGLMEGKDSLYDRGL